MKTQGVLQPVVLRPREDGGFELVAGERRWRAAQLAGLLKLPAVIREVDDDQLLELALIENIQREELNPVETALAYQTLINDLGLTQAEVAERVGKQRATVTNALRLLNLPSHVQNMVRDGKLTAGHARAMAALTQRTDQIDLAEKVVREGLSVRQTEAMIAKATKPNASSSNKTSTSTEPERDPNIVAAEERLQRAMGTKVKIHQGAKGGRIELHFFSPEEMERVYQILMKAPRNSRADKNVCRRQKRRQ